MAGPAAIAVRSCEVADLASVNEIIAAAMDTWQLSARIKRISLPLYRYQEQDLDHLEVLVAESKSSVVVGVAAIEPADKAGAGLSDWSLHGLYVMPEQHRRGIGSLLLESAEALATARGASGLLAKARPEAVTFFQHRGFIELAVEDHSRDYPHRFYKSL